ncbi:LysR family transcriptional regulator [Nonomuraea salmonea]|uniref:LysR family transcriptional regulator n=1 Tax=Nonomuraea salmonea TaxID=46181 RepID=UPI002FE812A8
MELRDIEIFLTLAEELHFGRTAERLHVTPARVSQAVKKQERRIGAALFERSSRAVALTPIGRQLFADLAPAYRGAA